MYKLIGTCKTDFHSTIDESFVTFQTYDTPRGAMDIVRFGLYCSGCSDILFKEVFKKSGDEWIQIPMMEALGLE